MTAREPFAKEELVQSLVRAFKIYTETFGEEPHGTERQIRGLVELGVLKALNAAFNKRLGEEIAKARASRDGMREALKKIAGADYRGNRSPESILAFNALAADKGE